MANMPKVKKDLKPGRVLIVSQGVYYNAVGVLLSKKNSKETIYRVFVLDNQTPRKNVGETKSDLWHSLMSILPKNKHIIPEGFGGHTILEIRPYEIVEITKSALKVDQESIIRNWEQRQIYRFKDAPVAPEILQTVSDLRNLAVNYKKDPKTLEFLNLFQLKLSSEVKSSEIDDLIGMWNEIKEILTFTDIVAFEQAFETVFERKSIEQEVADLKFKNSAQNLSLYPDYVNKLDVLHELMYINENEEVTLKGKVACEMGQNELLITELILSNVFNDLDSAEIAALLSGLVFQGKVNEEPEIPEKLKKYMKKFEETSDLIVNTELRHRVCSSDSSDSNRLNFGLIEVVYEWARKKPFSEIMGLTQIQEGIIVRCIQQLDETLQDVKTAAMRIGNPTLQSKMEEASNAIKRDIVFTASLYTAL